jgi:U4/U6.U5 tri-snRNP-associated protein 1
MPKKKAVYSSEDLKGIRVQHGLDDFEPGQADILVLKDVSVLDEAEDQEDVLVSSKVEEKTKTRARILSSKKRSFVGFDEEEGQESQEKVCEYLSLDPLCF